jgi:F0F1-type ATP synthase assembly protein I
MAPSAPDQRKRDDAEHALDLGRYAGLGFQFAGVLLAFGALGWWLDSLLGTGPWLLIVGIFLGAACAFIALLRAVPAARPRSPIEPTEPPPPTSTKHDRP